MAQKFRIHVDDAKAKAFFERMRKNAGNMQPAMGAIALEMHADVIDHFEKESGRDGKWTPLTDYTLQQRMKNRKGGKGGTAILQDTGMLRMSLTQAGSPYGINKVTKNTATVGTRVQYAALHQYSGTSQSGAQVPKREFLWMSDDAMDRVMNGLSRFIMND